MEPVAVPQSIDDPIHILLWSADVNTTESFNVKGTYIWQQTLALSVGYAKYDFPKPLDSLFGQRIFHDRTFLYAFRQKSSLAEPWLNLHLNLVYRNDMSSTKFPISRSDYLCLSGNLAF